MGEVEPGVVKAGVENTTITVTDNQ